MPPDFLRHPKRYQHLSKKRGRFLFLSFLFSFSMMLIFIVGTATVVRFIFDAVTTSQHGNIMMHDNIVRPDFSRLVGLGFLAILFPLIVFRLARRTMRQFTNPIEEIIQAAESVASGDLSIRVREVGRSGLGQLMKTFNRMVEQLENVDEQRRNLTADVAHELRTPLHILQGNIEAILDGVYNADEETLNAMLDETHALARMVDDLQTLSLAEAGQLHLHHEKINVNELLNDVATSFSGIAEKNQIHLYAKTTGNPEIIGDAGRLDQVLSNLITNAIRYTPENGEILLTATQIDAIIEIQVSDTGSGIPADDLPHVFNRFYRADKSRNREKGGAGLGLAIAKQLVELHEGTMSVESEVGVGTTFTIVLPSKSPSD